MNDIIKFIHDHNLPDLDLGKPSGQWHKLESDGFKGSYIFSVTTYKDKAVTILTVYNFKSGETLTERFGAEKLTKGELANVQKQIDDQNEKAAQEKRRKQYETKTYAQTEYATFSNGGDTLRSHPYLLRKQLAEYSEALGLRNGGLRSRASLLKPSETELVIPFYDITGELWNYQTITSSGDKQVLLGGRLEGLFTPILIGKLSDYDRVYLCEGYSTALTVSLALDQKYPVLACISSSNLKYVAESIRKQFPKLPYIICGDNDCWKSDQDNAGKVAAANVVSRIDGGAFGIPDFSGCDTTSKPTDYNDLLCLAGLPEVTRQVTSLKTNRPQVIYALGYNQRYYYFTTSKVSQIQTLTEFSESDLLKLAGMNYWLDRFDDGKGKWDLQKIKDKLIRECQDKGIFEHERIRGRGVYQDGERTIVHLGDRLFFPDTKVECDIADFESVYYYEPTTKQFPDIDKG